MSESEPEPVLVASRAELPPGGKKLLDVEGRAIALFNVEGHYYAIDDVCTHDGGPLADGLLEGCIAAKVPSCAVV